VELSAEIRAILHRPSGAFVERVNRRGRRRLHFDGSTLAFVDVDSNLYAQEPFEGTNADLLDHLHERFQAPLPLADFLAVDPAMALSEAADWGLYVGRDIVGGVECDHVLFSNEWLEWQVWVQSEEPRVPRRLVIVFADEPGQPRFTATLSNWNLDDDTTGAFDFHPAVGAVQVDLARSGDDTFGEEDSDEDR
jgi:hypothetical protein